MGSSTLMRWTAVIAMTGLLLAAATQAEPINDRMMLVEAIESVREQGFEIVYSSRLVKPWMRVRETPASTDPLAALNEVLATYQLGLAGESGERWLIVEAQHGPRVSPAVIRGRIVAADTALPISGALIRAGNETYRSDVDGLFEIQFAAGIPSDIVVRAGGYVSMRRPVDELAVSDDLVLSLQPFVTPRIDEVLIVASRYGLFDRRVGRDQFLTAEEIRTMPHLGDDAFRALHRLPGVAASDFQAPLHLRGGALDEVNVVLDGLELFEPYHMRSLFSPLSIIDPGIIRDAEILSGGFPVNHGNYMSGVIDISSEWPDGEAVHQVGVSFVSSFARSSGAFTSGRGGYQVSARRGYLDLITDQIVDAGEELKPRYGDIFAKATYVLSDTVDVAAHVLLAEDDVRFKDPGDGEDFGEDSSLRYGWIGIDIEPADGLRLNNVIFAGRTDSVEDGEQIQPPSEHIDRFYSRNVNVSGLKSDIELQADESRLWRFGIQYRHLEADFDYRIDAVRQVDFVNNGQPYSLHRDLQVSSAGDEFGAYAAFRYRPLSRLTVEFGGRWDRQTYADTSDDSQMAGRFNGLVQLGQRTDLRFAWGVFHQPQGIENLQLQDGVTQYYPAERAEHRVLGLRHAFLSGIELQADLYDKRYDDLRPRFENALDIYEYAGESNFDRVRVAPEEARAYGIEFTVRRRKTQGFDWLVNYTWSRAEDRLGGVDVPRSWDQEHAVTGNLVWRGQRWTLSVLGRYHSGWPRTPLLVLPVFDNAGGIIGIDSDLSQRNDTRFDDYSRVDIRLSRRVDLRRGSFEYYFELFNVFDSKNECCVSNHQLNIGPGVAVTPLVDHYMPLFPSFGFVWTFGPGAD